MPSVLGGGSPSSALPSAEVSDLDPRPLAATPVGAQVGARKAFVRRASRFCKNAPPRRKTRVLSLYGARGPSRSTDDDRPACSRTGGEPMRKSMFAAAVAGAIALLAA